MKSTSEKKSTSAILPVVFVIIVTLAVFIHAGLFWVMSVWNNLDVNEIIFHITSPIQGTGNGIIRQYVIKGLLPAIIALISAIVTVLCLKKKKDRNTIFKIGTYVSAAVIVLSIAVFWQKVGIGKYIIEQTQDSKFIEENYVNPADVSITFPGQKRNLVYIFLESVETTYTDKAHGGGFDFDCIPELTELALENECFAGDTGKLNGGYVMPGTNFTMGGMFAQTCGLPLKLGISDSFLDGNGSWNNMDTQDSFFKDVTALGDILHQNGYNQEILMGSDSEFGGRKMYFEEHGSYGVKDLIYAKDAGWLPQDYYVFWGFEDEKLFEYARNEMLELSERNEPFNLSLLTVDTHFEDGYVCHLCDDEFGENQYANVMACSSRQVCQLIEWIRQQDFYENTTIVLSGDHTTMDSNFCDEVDEDYGRRTYTAVINPASEPEEPGKERLYTTLDIFPTTLGALGARIEGDRLGIGTNLFSSVPTLAEEYTLDTMTAELDKKSRFMSELSDMDLSKAELYARDTPEGRIVLKSIDETKASIEVDAMDFKNLDEEFGSAYIVIKNTSDDEWLHRTDLAIDGRGRSSHLTGSIDISGIDLENAYMAVYATGKSGIDYPEVAVIKGNLYMNNWDHYMDYLADRLATGDYTLFISAREEASGAVDDAVLADLQRLGIKTDLRGKWRESYYAVITPEGVAEEVSSNRLEYNGTLPDGSAYKVISEGYDSGRLSSIMFEDGEHSINRRGLNFVLYNNKTGEVEDSVNFDTNEGLGASRDPKRNGQL